MVRDSSLSLTQKLSSAILPATAIAWMSKKRNQGIDSSNIEDFEMRVSGLENQMSVFNTVFINDTDINTQATRRIEFIEQKEDKYPKSDRRMYIGTTMKELYDHIDVKMARIWLILRYEIWWAEEILVEIKY